MTSTTQGEVTFRRMYFDDPQAPPAHTISPFAFRCGAAAICRGSVRGLRAGRAGVRGCRLSSFGFFGSRGGAWCSTSTTSMRSCPVCWDRDVKLIAASGGRRARPGGSRRRGGPVAAAASGSCWPSGLRGGGGDLANRPGRPRRALRVGARAAARVAVAAYTGASPTLTARPRCSRCSTRTGS
jgi:hypothetical protein